MKGTAVLPSMTPSGVEHIARAIDMIADLLVLPSMTPSGVEHCDNQAPDAGALVVLPSMTPSGVEHLADPPTTIDFAVAECFLR